MKLRNIATLALTLISALVFAQVDRSKLPEPATPRPIEIGNYESFELKNGLKVFIIENHKLPRVTYNLQFDRDAIFEGDKAGYLDMFGQTMRTGTDTRSKEKLDEEIDFIGASLGAGSTSVFASGLSKYEETIVELMTDVAFNPTFDSEEFEKIRKQTLSGLAQNKETPDAIARNLNSAIVYGADHPYGELQTEETTNNVTTEDFVNYHDAYIRPNIAYLIIVGDVNLKNTKKLVKTYFSNWEAKEVKAMTYATPASPAKNRVNIVNRANSVQSVVNISYPVLLPIGHPDEIGVRVMNTILGGGFSSKLNMNLREDKGYTYGARSSLSSDELVANFNASASVRNEVTDSSVVQMLFEMKQMIDGNITNEELDLAKNSIAGSFSRSLESPQTVANFALNTAVYKLPGDYYSTYIQRLQALTIDDIKALAKKYIKPENVYINIVGKGSDIADKLKVFGEVKYFDTYGNEVDPSLAKLPEGLTVETVLSNYKKALGGAEVVDKIENVTFKMSAEMMGQKLSVENILAKGMKAKMSIEMSGMAVMTSISNGNDASITQMGNKAPLDDATKEEQIIANSLFAELGLKERGAKMTLAGVESINDKDAYGVEVTLSKGNKYTVYFDATTGLKVRYLKVIETPQGVFNQAIDYSDYKAVNGVLFPYVINQNMGPQKIKMEVSEVIINSDLAADTFKIE